MDDIRLVGPAVTLPTGATPRVARAKTEDMPVVRDGFASGSTRPPTLLSSRPVLQANQLPPLMPPTSIPSVKTQISASKPSTQAKPHDLGPGFPSAPAQKESVALKLHDWLASRVPCIFGVAANEALKVVSDVTSQHIGVNVQDLLNVEQTMYRVMVPSRDGYIGGAPPIFQSLANGQAAFVYIDGHPDESDHLTRLFTGLPPQTLQQLGAGNDELTSVKQKLLDRMQAGQFPAYISADGNLQHVTGTDSIATESISSIALRQNVLSCDFPDPNTYYRWLVTRVDSAFHRTDPWLFAVKPELHAKLDTMKEQLTPSWVTEPGKDPLGFAPTHKQTEKAYNSLMEIAGGGKPPTYDTFTDFADTVISLDRDLEFAVQTYWVKFLREIGPVQRESLMVPLARSWVALNVLAPDDPNFSQVSPDNAPYIELIDKHSGESVMERYDRSVALGEVVNHSADGLGFAQRKKMLDVTMSEIRAQADAIKAREARLRGQLGDSYQGLDIDAILDDRIDASDPKVKAALQQLQGALGTEGAQVHPMTPLHADTLRHLQMVEWVATRNLRYRDQAMALARKIPMKPDEPLIVGQFWKQNDATPPSALPPGPTRTEILGKPRAGISPLKASIVLEGGGGLGFAYGECLRNTEAALQAADGQVEIDEFIGTSAGSITAGLLAAGYHMSDIGAVQSQLDFKKFYADYLWLAGASDPAVRGIDRTGLFSTRQMYQTIRDLIAQKVKVQGRPVLFRDLPFKLKIISTVINTDLPEDLKKQLGIGPDGQIVFSSENTPNMDVAAAMCASSSVPTFFEAPQISVIRPESDGQGGKKLAEYRLQLVDGGTVNNFASSVATDRDDKRSLLTCLPAYYQSPALQPGQTWVSLSALDFDQTVLPQINAYNDQRYAQFAPQFANFLQKARDEGCPRAIIGFNPAGISEQSGPILQGRNRAATEHLHDMASQVGFRTATIKEGTDVVRGFYPQHRPFWEQLALDKLLDTDHTFKPGLCHPPQFKIGTQEATGIGDIMIAVTAANVAGSGHLDRKLFEQG